MQQRMNATEQAIQSIKDLTSAQQRLGVVGDETQMMGAQQLATFLNSTDALKTLIPAMNDLAVQQNGYNVSSEAMVGIGNLMGKVMQGQVSALTRVGITFTEAQEEVLKFGTEEERAAVLAQVITDNVGHMNEALAQTDSGKIQQAKNNFGDLKEMIGARLIPVVAQFYDKINSASLFIIDNFDEIISVAEDVAIVLGGLILALKAPALVGAVMSIINAFQLAGVKVAYFAIEVGATGISAAAAAGSLTVMEIVAGALTGQISLATAAQALFNKTLLANPIVAVTAAVVGLGFAIKKLCDYDREYRQSLYETTETSEEAADAIENIKQKIAEYEAIDPALWTDMHQAEYDQLRIALKEAEGHYDELKAAEEEAAAKAAEPATKFQESMDSFEASFTEFMGMVQQTYEQTLSSIQGWFKPFEQASVSVETSLENIMSGMQSQIDFNNQYTANMNYLKEQGLQGVADALKNYGAEGAAYAQTMVTELQNVGGATTEAGQALVEEFNSKVTELEASQEGLSEIFTSMSDQVISAMEDMVTKYGEQWQEMNMSEEALEGATATMDSYKQGIETGGAGVLAAVDSICSQISAKLSASLASVQSMAGSVGGGHAGFPHKDGLDYVPYDEYPARLHKGEAVLTASEAAAWRAGKSADSGSGGSSGSVQASASESQTVVPVVLNITEMIDGMKLAQNQYKYNMIVSRNHGVSLVKGV